jgi:hypothetical protein
LCSHARDFDASPATLANLECSVKNDASLHCKQNPIIIEINSRERRTSNMHFAHYHQLHQEGTKGGRLTHSLGKYQKNSVGSGGIGGTRIEETSLKQPFGEL